MKSLALHPSSRLVDQLEIAAPCHAKWEDMVGDERTRFCGQCTKNVYNVTFMTSDEVAHLITATEGRACMRLFRRKDGTVITSDCPVGLAERAYKRARRMALAAVALVATLSGGLFASLVRPSCDVGSVTPLHERIADQESPGFDGERVPGLPVVEPSDDVLMGEVAVWPPEEPVEVEMGKPAPRMGRVKVR